ncbi:Insulin-degrading enzyme [Durusdinium trenchii]|uniref:Insulin-degrading enzyme n=1 Tax=Durusdinium trenchii TaxID=1381693 RepID=A0ABP0Q2P9_9DINO
MTAFHCISLVLDLSLEDRSFVFESWYGQLAPVTFLSRSVALQVEDIEALARATDDALALIPSSKRRSCDDQRLERLRRKLDEAIDEVGTSAFVRLNYLSPKDAVMDNLQKLGAAGKWPEFQEKVRKEMPDVDEDTRRNISAIRMLVSLTRVKTGEEALWMLTNSHRTFEDFWLRRLRIQSSNIKGIADRIQVRRWEERLLVETELRGFVFGGALTALTQYHCCSVVPRFVEDPAGTLQKVQEFFGRHVRARLSPFQACIVDFAFLEDGGMRVIELNPFGPQTGALLFDWQRDALILAGWWSQRPVFRYVKNSKEAGGYGQLPLKQILAKLDSLS